ncbi:MAG: hypothetical protein UT34_C0002G0091 [candidate division WS6 bacterium GW2011_GWF2_39_15]|uniref:Uncharacterized protein n=1 Tax=candidate division WS6 bacterium GW2011_GWF2_39_15 TaxID=1619100 RepID=A0A0G0MNF3_9BACT|nr:MAG: hypothetical protein UT34_C0002G0091 [candidate division WS6 bacterium GW2011_GWF2_39_15]
MKQHPIPQNILDIEFKLFTRFTVREFVYMAVGIGFGGIFLYFFTKGQLPGIIAIPIFLVSSGIGLFLGLVPINDQKADSFLKNYIVAITNPTQRVWKNEKMLNKEELTDELEMTHGSMQRNPNEAGSAKIVGADSLPTSQFIDNPLQKELDAEEETRLAAIGTGKVETQPVPQQPQTEAKKAEPPKSAPNMILISRETLSNFGTIQSGTNPGVGFQVNNSDGTPNSEAIIAIKGNAGNVIFAQKTDANGIVIMSKTLDSNRYRLVIQSKDKTYSNIELVSDGKPLPIIKLTLG